jgi:imidazolonepropionase-like amidohydrolase
MMLSNRLIGIACGIVLVGLCVGPAAAQSNAPGTLVLTHANVIDGVSSAPMMNATVIVEGGVIRRIETNGSSEPPSGAKVLDLNGRWLLPGFVDAHAHIADLPSARRALRSGVTTARDLGVDHFADIGLRELNHAGVADVPDIVAAGYHVRPRPADAFFLDFPQFAEFLGTGMHGPNALRAMVKALADRGVNLIKVMATERAGLPETDPRIRVFTEAELAAVVDEARAHGLFVAAHAHGDEGAAAAVRAGVHSIEHGTWLSDATLRLIKEKDVCFVPTLAATLDETAPGGDYDNPMIQLRGRAMLPRAREVIATAWKMGIRIAAGPDTGYSEHSVNRLTDEIVALHDAGLPNMDAIKAGTSVAADCLGVSNRVGALKPGYEADLVVIERSPLRDIGYVRDVLVVINNGRIAVNRLEIEPRS